MSIFHTVYGLRLTANVAIPGLPILSNSNGNTDVRIRLKQEAFPLPDRSLRNEVFYVSRLMDSNGEPAFRTFVLSGGTHFEISYCDGARFVIARTGCELLADWPDRLTLEDISPYILGPVLGFVLRLRGVFSLHASAVSLGNHAIALMGPAGAGKSSTAGAFVRCGHRVISDDVVALRQEGPGFVVPPGYPRVNLWAESVQGLFGAHGALPRISPDWDKHFMPLDQENQFEARSLPLGAIYYLQEREAGLAAPILETVTGADALIALQGNAYMNCLSDPEMRRHEFELWGRVLAQVPVRRVRAIADWSKLHELCETIAVDARDLLPNNAR